MPYKEADIDVIKCSIIIYFKEFEQIVDAQKTCELTESALISRSMDIEKVY